MYLERKKKARTAHVWNGTDTSCRMYSTGGLRKNAYQLVEKTDLPICVMCANSKPKIADRSAK